MGIRRESPRNSPKKKNTLKQLFELDSKPYVGSPLSSPGGAGIDYEHEEFLSAITDCSLVFTFTDPQESPSQQDLKRLRLIQVVSLLKSSRKPLQEDLVSRLVSMVAVNLFRPLPPPSNSTSVISALPDEDDLSTFTPLWPHLQLVYDILLRLVVNVDPKKLKDYINHRFVRNLLFLFQSEDPREREGLKNVFHRIYSRFTSYRSFMREAMNDVFLHYIFETERHCGIGELLEIWGSIINGFGVPLKVEHKLFLMRVLLPLHKGKGLQVYHRQLAYCVAQFVQKEPALGGIIVRRILRYWPITNCHKEVLLIGELEELVENIDPDQYRTLAVPLCSRITRCLKSCNSQVAERALYVWNNEQFVKMASAAMEEVFPVVVQGMESNLKMHWSKSVKQLTENVKSMLEEMDPTLYEKCLREIDCRESEARREQIRRQQRWTEIEMAASKQNHFLQPTKSMYVSSH
ncbi:serine/threonine protein phosphatase 2A 57 kDa regulatory subunit B' beta isoform-like [Hibiscus syriacus]|uniref:serine/threonine protein phosphatase 2A 57 kDa regulatory subunit B' beta isoform-like n=1 Tax=Hibiscus syriacus TaxID=106335 RepID=UPI001921A039|nr:serine/threonine protein phosphatase 2A 57 kDa regulatory subunit B' beta isoform-like [Hibiscus syriacus]